MSRVLAGPLSLLWPCGPGEPGPICDGPALVDAVMAVSSPASSVAAVVAQAGEPSWYYGWDVAGTWLGAIGTIAASAIALWLGLKAVRDQRDQREAQERTQANRVTLLRQFTPGRPVLLLRNDSDLPITKVRVASKGAMEHELRDLIESIGPGEATTFHYGGIEHMHNSAVAEFDDAAGRTWLRMLDGELHQVIRYGTSSAIRRKVSPSGEVRSIEVRQHAGSEWVSLRHPLMRRKPPVRLTLHRPPALYRRMAFRQLRGALSKPGGWKQVREEWPQEWAVVKTLIGGSWPRWLRRNR